MLSNFTNDLLFSVERLSTQPFSVRRLSIDEDLPFEVEDDVAEEIASLSVSKLQAEGRLFYIDYSHLAELETNDKFGAACEAYFFIHPDSGDFLPLAIKTNTVQPSLIYTPEDEPMDWLFAKMMFNQNDFWQGAWYHLASTHFVFEIVFMAAVRTLSVEHPIRAILDRRKHTNFGPTASDACADFGPSVSEQAFAFRPNAFRSLFAEGAFVDQLLPWSGRVAANYANDLYNAESGRFQSNYFRENLRSRGLVHAEIGPPLTSFPFYDDASRIVSEIENFFLTMIDSYYTSTESIREDLELQSWIVETNGPANVQDFPSGPVEDKQTVVDMLSHMAYLVSVLHQTLNTDVPVHSTATLPFHPMAFYQELPTEKGIDDILPFMPTVSQSITQISLLANFNRPSFIKSNVSLTEMFNDSEMLDRLNEETQEAAGAFKVNLEGLSDEIQGRGFNEDGLAQGMPFIWNALDPRIAPFFLTV